MRLEGWTVERIKGINYFIKNIPLLGGILKIQRPEVIDFQVIDNLSRKHRIFQVIVEPKNNLQAQILASNSFRLSRKTYTPSKSLLIDLAKSEAAIYKDLKRNIKKGIKRGEGFPAKEYRSPDEIKIFREAWKKIIKNKRYVPTLQTLLNLRKSFPQNKSLYLASHNISGRIIGGVIFTITSHDGSNYITSYMYGFTSEEGRSSLSHASLLYQGILWGKKMGCKVFDFEGIYDSRFPDKDWLGFTRFKKSFGGYEVFYPGCYTKLRLPI
jgi:hypothetical protein